MPANNPIEIIQLNNDLDDPEIFELDYHKQKPPLKNHSPCATSLLDVASQKILKVNHCRYSLIDSTIELIAETDLIHVFLHSVLPRGELQQHNHSLDNFLLT